MGKQKVKSVLACLTQEGPSLLVILSPDGTFKLKRDEIMNHASHGQAIDSQSSDQNSTYTSQATNLLQQTGEQVKHMAQEAADAVKSTLGMNSADNASNAPNPSTNHPSNPSPRT